MDKIYELNSFFTANDLVLHPANAEVAVNDRASNPNEACGDRAPLCADKEPRLNPREKTSISALVAYVAFTRKIREDAVLRMLCGRFGTRDVAGIRGSDYDDVVRFLVDFGDSEAALN